MKWSVWVLAVCAFAQNDPQDYKISTDVNRVLLAVSVRDRAGAFVSGLQQSDFVVYEDGRPQTIRYFSSDDVPVSVGLVLDNSGSMHTKRTETNLAALQFLGASNPNDEVFVVNFNDSARLGLPDGVPFSSDRNDLAAALTRAHPSGKTALYDAIELALDHVQKGKQDRKAILVISDGGDNASHVNFDTVLDMAKRYNTTIYTVGIYDDDDRDKNPGVLKKLAGVTGGEMFRPEKLSEIPEVTRKIAHDLRTQYTLAYEPPGGTNEGAYHQIRVVASAPGRGKLKIRTREGYLAPAAAAQSSEQQTSATAADSPGSGPK